MTLNCRGKLIDLSLPIVMGILNITPDSFHDGGRFLNIDIALAQAEKMLHDGAKIIDIGGMSSRPGANVISPAEEISRVLPVVLAVVKHFPEAIISVDTLHAEVARETLEAGAHIINDISAGLYDSNMPDTVARYAAPYIIMHMPGLPDTMQQQATYADIVTELYNFFEKRIKACTLAGITDIIIDPGYGFGKTTEHNYTLLRNQVYFTNLRLPILSGVSRKSLICKVLHVNAAEALNGTTAVNMLALLNGAAILRVHDVKEAMQCIAIWQAYRGISTHQNN